MRPLWKSCKAPPCSPWQTSPLWLKLSPGQLRRASWARARQRQCWAPKACLEGCHPCPGACHPCQNVPNPKGHLQPARSQGPARHIIATPERWKAPGMHIEPDQPLELTDQCDVICSTAITSPTVTSDLCMQEKCACVPNSYQNLSYIVQKHNQDRRMPQWDSPVSYWTCTQGVERRRRAMAPHHKVHSMHLYTLPHVGRDTASECRYVNRCTNVRDGQRSTETR